MLLLFLAYFLELLPIKKNEEDLLSLPPVLSLSLISLFSSIESLLSLPYPVSFVIKIIVNFTLINLILYWNRSLYYIIWNIGRICCIKCVLLRIIYLLYFLFRIILRRLPITYNLHLLLILRFFLKFLVTIIHYVNKKTTSCLSVSKIDRIINLAIYNPPPSLL